MQDSCVGSLGIEDQGWITNVPKYINQTVLTDHKNLTLLTILLVFADVISVAFSTLDSLSIATP